MNPTYEDGWIRVPCDAPDRAAVFITVGKDPGESDWRPAFRDWDGKGTRVAQIRPPDTGTLTVWLRVDGQVRKLRRSVTV
jgi:hypothetical protein